MNTTKKQLSLFFPLIIFIFSINIITPNVKGKSTLSLQSLELMTTANAEIYNDTIIYTPMPYSPVPYPPCPPSHEEVIVDK